MMLIPFVVTIEKIENSVFESDKMTSTRKMKFSTETQRKT